MEADRDIIVFLWDIVVLPCTFLAESARECKRF